MSDDRYNKNSQFMQAGNYKKAVQLHETYKQIRAKLDVCRGLISPIRAIVFNNDGPYKSRYELVQDIINTVTRIQFTPNSAKLAYFRVSVADSDTAFMNSADIVGYCVAIPNTTALGLPYLVGTSYCRPEDYACFNREFGIVKAYQHATDAKTNTLCGSTDPEDKLITTNERKTIFYFWPNSFNKQINDFCQRAYKYFKSVESEID